MNEHHQWTAIALNDIVFKNNIAKITIDEKSICLIKTPSGFRACSSLCPHASGDLSDGFIDAKGNIVCPVHGYRFNLNNGRDCFSEGYFLRIYLVKEENGQILIKLA